MMNLGFNNWTYDLDLAAADVDEETYDPDEDDDDGISGKCFVFRILSPPVHQFFLDEALDNINVFAISARDYLKMNGQSSHNMKVRIPSTCPGDAPTSAIQE